MITTTINTRSTVDSYWNIIKHLSPDVKLDLIALLTKSLKKTTRKRVSAKKHYGVWGDDSMTDDEFVDELKSRFPGTPCDDNFVVWETESSA